MSLRDSVKSRRQSVPSTPSKRSPSPRLTFTHITRTVIKRLEGFGHVDTALMLEEDEEEEGQVEQSLRPQLKQPSNGSATAPNRKIDWEIPRKLLHSSIGFFTVYLYISQGSARTVVYVLWSALAIIAPADFLRLRYPAFERLYERCLGFLMRESEKHTTNGVTWYILGVNFALMSYPLDVATVAILILSWADTAASTIGRLCRGYTSSLPSRLPLLRLPLAPRKSLAGFIAASVTGALIAVTFWGWIVSLRDDPADVTWQWNTGVKDQGPKGWLGLAIIGAVTGLVSGVAEALDLGSWDDNLTLPIISGACMLGLFKLLSFL